MPLIIKTAEQVHAENLTRAKVEVTRAIDEHVEAQARALDYNNAARLTGYANSTVPKWKAEAEAFIAWNDACWVAALDMLAQAEASGEVPEIEDVIAALPEWPGVEQD